MEDSATDEDNLGEVEQEVTVEVIPRTVTKIIYLSEETDTDKTDSNSFVQWEDEEDADEAPEQQLYEIGSVDIENRDYTNRPLILDESESFVLLSPDDVDMDSSIREYINLNTVCLENIDGSHEHLNIIDVGSSAIAATKIKTEHMKCSRCSLSFDTAQKLSTHFKQKHNNSSPIDYSSFTPTTKHTKFTCDKCGAILNNGVELMQHKQSHGTTMLYACNKCDAEFSSTAEVSHHLRLSHSAKKKPEKPAGRVRNAQKRHANSAALGCKKDNASAKKCRRK